MNTKTICLRACLLAITLAGLISLLGCRPSIHDVIKVISTVPLGTSRVEMWHSIARVYPKQVFAYNYVTPALPLTDGQIQAIKHLMEVTRNRGRFVRVYPLDLFDKLPAKAYSDVVGMIRESTVGGGSLTVIYDSNTNYIGFLAESYK